MTIEDQQSGLPDCWFQGPLEIPVSSGPFCLRVLFMVEVSCLLLYYEKY